MSDGLQQSGAPTIAGAPGGADVVAVTKLDQAREVADERRASVAAAGEVAGGHARAAEQVLVLEDLLVEDVSIDGMCGVY
jgi:mycofactocin precursor